MARGSAGGLVATGRWSVADTPADCCVNFHSPRGPRQGEDGDRVEKASTASWEWAGAPHSAATLPSEHPGGPGEAHAPGHTKLQPPWMPGLWEPAQAAHSSCWYLITGSGQGGSVGLLGRAEPGDTQGSHWACREPLVLPPWPTTGSEVSRPFHLWPCPSRLCRSGTGALGKGVVTSFQVLRVSWAQP